MATKEEFIRALDEAYAADRDLYLDHGGDPAYAAYVFLAGSVFDFTLYDYAKEVQWAREMLRVIRAILGGTTFAMFSLPSSGEVYLKMVNMPFLKDLLTWGGSIRGAWFDTYGDERFEYCCGSIVVERKDVKVFMEAIMEWADANLSDSRG